MTTMLIGNHEIDMDRQPCFSIEADGIIVIYPDGERVQLSPRESGELGEWFRGMQRQVRLRGTLEKV